MTFFSKKPIIIIYFILISSFVHAQYGTALGVRYGTETNIGISVLRFLSDRNQGASHTIVSFPYKGARLTSFYEWHFRNHNENIEVANVGFFVGLGAHVGRYKKVGWQKNDTPFIKGENVVAFGVDANAGIEWKIPTVPLLLSIDVHPLIDLNYIEQQPQYFDFGLSLRYLF